jgi:hypothetical protein
MGFSIGRKARFLAGAQPDGRGLGGLATAAAQRGKSAGYGNHGTENQCERHIFLLRRAASGGPLEEEMQGSAVCYKEY